MLPLLAKPGNFSRARRREPDAWGPPHRCDQQRWRM